MKQDDLASSSTTIWSAILVGMTRYHRSHLVSRIANSSAASTVVSKSFDAEE